jgi:hypothetical protein
MEPEGAQKYWPTNRNYHKLCQNHNFAQKKNTSVKLPDQPWVPPPLLLILVAKDNCSKRLVILIFLLKGLSFLCLLSVSITAPYSALQCPAIPIKLFWRVTLQLFRLTVAGNVKWCSCYGKQCGSSLKN